MRLQEEVTAMQTGGAGMRGKAELELVKNNVGEDDEEQEADQREERQESPRQDSYVQQLSVGDYILAGEEKTKWNKELRAGVEVCHIHKELSCDANSLENTTVPHVVVLRRPSHGLRLLGRRRAMSIFVFPDDHRTQQTAATNHQERSGRPHSVCMLGATNSSLIPLAFNNKVCPVKRCRTRRAELRVVDGLKPDMPPYGSIPIHPQEEPLIRQTLNNRGRPRPVSMTVLELKAHNGSRDELVSHTATDTGSLPRSGFHWRWFSRQAHGKEVVATQMSGKQKELIVTKAERPKRTFGSLQRSLSLRIRRNRNQPEQKDRTERRRTASIGEKSMQTTHPFSYLTGRTLTPTREQDEDQGAPQNIEYQTRGKLAVLEVPLFPAKLTKPTKQTQGDTSFWQLIASRFKRKDLSSSNKSELCTGRNKKPDSVAIETLAGIGFRKGQDSFVNSQEWTLSRSVPELKVGIVGNLSSGKSALVHRYLTGTYVQEESPEGELG